jgi:hypothetical protein
MLRLSKTLRGHMPLHLERSEYCQHQAEECASRATITKLPEVKDAYLQLELGWRQLVSDFDPVPNVLAKLKDGNADCSVHSEPLAETKKETRRRRK